MAMAKGGEMVGTSVEGVREPREGKTAAHQGVGEDEAQHACRRCAVDKPMIIVSRSVFQLWRAK